QQRAHEFTRVALRLEDKSGAGGVPKRPQQMKQNGRLPHAGLGDKADKPTIGLYAVIKRSQRFAMCRAEIEEPGIRRYPERLVSQFKKTPNNWRAKSPLERYPYATA